MSGNNRARRSVSVPTVVGALVGVIAAAAMAVPAAARGAGSETSSGATKGAAGRGAVIEGAADDDARIDWTRGLVIGTGAAAADMRAPSAEIARVRAERQARERALAAARTRLDKVKAVGESVAALASLDGLGPRIDDTVVKRARDIEVHYGSDGSATVTVGVPLEAVRAAALARAADLAASGKAIATAPTAVIVDARQVARLAPVLGLRIEVGGDAWAAPTVYTTDIEAARADARLGERPVEATAATYEDGVLALRAGEGLDKLAAARQPLVVVVLKGRSKGGKR